MKVTGWLRAFTAVIAMITAACVTKGADPTPEPPVDTGAPGQDVTFEGFPDTLDVLLAAVEDSAPAASDAEVEAEVREMFGESELAELEKLEPPESEIPSWDIPITISRPPVLTASWMALSSMGTIMSVPSMENRFCPRYVL